MRTYHLFANITADTDNAASVTIQQSGRIRQIQYSLSADLDGDAEEYGVDLSFVPKYAGGDNDATGILFSGRNRASAAGTPANLVTDGQTGMLVCDVPVKSGDKIYINADVAGTGSVKAVFNVYVY